MISKAVFIGVVSLSCLVARAATAETCEAAFAKANDAAMDRMMRDMNVRPAGNVDIDFVNAMEPHHQGAIDMAILELRYGANDRLRRIAQEIIVDQQQEIAAMRLAVGRPLPPSTATPDQPSRLAQLETARGGDGRDGQDCTSRQTASGQTR